MGGRGAIRRAGATCLLAAAALLPRAGAAESEARPYVATSALEISGFAGIQWGGEISGEGGRLDFDSAAGYGAQIGVRVQKDGHAIVSYQRQRSAVTARFDDGSAPTVLEIDVGYLQVGGELELPVNPHLIPIVGLTVGATHLSPRGSGGSTQWFFSGTAFAGVKVPISEHFGLRAQMRFLGTVISGDTDFLCISNAGLRCAISVRDVEGLIQGDLGAGLYFAF